jgi:hypothetical protein
MGHGTFEITLYPSVADLAPTPGAPPAVVYPVTAMYRPPGMLLAQRAGGKFAFDPARLLASGFRDPRDYGLALGKRLFRGAIRGLFRTALAETPADDSLHVLLALEAPSLRDLGWERLCGPLDDGEAGWDFLGLSQRTPLALYVAGATDRRFPPVGFGAFRVLVVVASPAGSPDAPPFDVEAAYNAVLRGLGGTPGQPADRCVVLARVGEVVGPPTLDAILEQLTADRFTVLHLVCHGLFARGAGDFYLMLERDDGTADRVAGRRLVKGLRRLAGRHLPYLTFLCSCESNAGGRSDHDRFAQVLARELALPAVVGMAERVSVTTAGRLTSAFYGRLREHGRRN